MGNTWRYCIDCGKGMIAPTPKQIADNEYNCEHCGAKNDPLKTIGEVIDELIERIERLENPPEGIEMVINKSYT